MGVSGLAKKLMNQLKAMSHCPKIDSHWTREYEIVKFGAKFGMKFGLNLVIRRSTAGTNFAQSSKFHIQVSFGSQLRGSVGTSIKVA